MTTRHDIAGAGRLRKAGRRALVPVLVGGAALLVGIPSAGLAVVASGSPAPRIAAMMQFTPANGDPAAIRRIAAKVAARGQELRFTPARAVGAAPRTVTVAIRVDDSTARAISVRSAIAAAEVGQGPTLATLAPARFNLGIARGYRSFAKPAAPVVPVDLGLDRVSLPDLASFRPREGAKEKPSRFQGNLALESESRAGRSPGTLEGQGGQAVDLSTGYRVSRSLNVTAGVRLTQDRDRLAPLTDGVRDDQAVYVGTQFRF